MTRLYGGLSRTRSAFMSSSFQRLGKVFEHCDDEFSNADSCRLGRIHVSNGNRGA